MRTVFGRSLALGCTSLLVCTLSSAGLAATPTEADCSDRLKRLSVLSRVWQVSLLSASNEAKRDSLALLTIMQPAPNEKGVTIASDSTTALTKLSDLLSQKAANLKSFDQCKTSWADIDTFIKTLETNLPTNIDTPWCDGGFTWCTKQRRPIFNGIRLIAEPQLGTLFQTGDDKLELDKPGSIQMVGFATDLKGRFLGLQTHVVFPGEVNFTPESSVVRVNAEGKNGLVRGGRTVHVEFGLGLGLTVFDGSFAFGVSFLNLDSNDFLNPKTKENPTGVRTHNTSFFLALQPITAGRALVNAIKN